MTTLGQAVVLGQGLRVAGTARVPSAQAGPGVIVVPAPGGLFVFEHRQLVPATVWGPIEHNLGRRPVAWSLFDSDDIECDEFVVQHLDLNSLRVSMDVPTAGHIRLI